MATERIRPASVSPSIFELRPLKQLSLNQLVITAGLLANAPEFINRLPILASAVRLGMAYDDCFDFGIVDRRRANVPIAENQGEFSVDLDYYHKYQKSWEDFITAISSTIAESTERGRLVENTRRFTKTVFSLEHEALRRKEKWAEEDIQKYREAVNIVWSTYVGSLLSQSTVNLLDLDINITSAEVLEEYKFIVNPEDGDPYHRKTAAIYYGSMGFQVIIDTINRTINKKYFLQGFGTHDNAYEKEGGNDKLLGLREEYFRLAKSFGMSSIQIALIKSFFALYSNYIKRFSWRI